MKSRKRLIAVCSAVIIAVGTTALPRRAAAQKAQCDQGGVGSSTCSAQGSRSACSVTCGMGYYACCNYNILTSPSCTCKDGSLG